MNKEYVIHIKDLDIQISRRKIKNINLYIRQPDAHILVTAPLKASDSYIENFIESKYDWIVLHRNKLLEQNKNIYEKDFFISEAEINWLKEKIQEYAKKWEPVINVHCNTWTIRKMKTRWGSCSTVKHTIRINSLLVKKPEKCLEYVIVHELVHMLEPSHNKVFKAYMTHFLPDWKEREGLLK